MPRVKKKGQAGQAKNYITRTQAVRKLQISLPDFRRLCIFKGIYPREPRSIKKANKSATHSTTFYYTKDIQYLLHEPLLAKLRDQKALQKKIAKSLGRNEVQDALRLERNNTPRIKLDHIVRERYPTFIDALRDLDDALSLLFLFANLPSTETVPPKVIAKCQRLCHEFEHYLITTNSLRKSFLSIKGIYYQATIQGQDIMWLVPYRFVQRVTQDVDYRIMGTFVEFYCTLLGFVSYRLYTSVGLVYPPKFDTGSDERGAELAAFTLEGRNVAENTITNGEAEQAQQIENSKSVNTAQTQAAINQIAQQNSPDSIPVSEAVDIATQDRDDEREQGEPSLDTTAVDKFQIQAPNADDLPQPSATEDTLGSLFSNFTFYISREAPRHPIEFIVRAFGCKRVGWDRTLGEGAYTFDETDIRITHQVVDKPPPSIANGTKSTKTGYVVPGRIYIQPQWIWDSINDAKLLRTDIYAPGETLPPHLSPWMRPTKGQYDPRATLDEQQAEGEEDDEEEEELSEEEVQELLENAEPDISDDGEEDGVDDAAEGMLIDVDTDSNDDDVEEGVRAHSKDDFAGLHEAVDEVKDGNDSEDQLQAELTAEAEGIPLAAAKHPSKDAKNKRKQERSTKEKAANEEIERQKLMMSNKKRKLYEKMQHGNAAKDAEAATLRKKRRKIEKDEKR